MRPPFFAFYPADFANDINVEAMSTLQVGAYLLLLCKAWQSDPPASLPSDDVVLARLARVDSVTWAEIKTGVLAPFHVGADGRLHNKRLRLEYDKAARLLKSRRAAGSEGGKETWRRITGKGGKPKSSALAELQRRSGAAEPNQIEDTEEEKDKDTPPPPAEPGGGERGYPAIAANDSTLGGIPGPTKHDPDPPRSQDPVGGGKDPPGDEGVVRLEEFAELVAEWDAAKLPGAGQVKRTPRRVGLWQQRLNDAFWRAHWRAAVARAGRCSRCHGADTSWPSGLRLDTFLKDPDMLVRILEGEFDDAPAGKVAKKANIADVIAARKAALEPRGDAA